LTTTNLQFQKFPKNMVQKVRKKLVVVLTLTAAAREAEPEARKSREKRVERRHPEEEDGIRNRKKS